MSRRIARSAGWILVLALGIVLSACGGDEHKDHKDHGTESGYPK
jgi:hypothetical protein